MAIDLCFYFQVHQPWRLRHYRFLEVGKNHQYFDEEKNAQILRKVANKCYLPMNNLIYDLVNEFGGAFKCAYSITGTVIEQMEAYAPEVIPSFKRLFETGNVELLSETSHHSLSALYSPDEFKSQVELHRTLATEHLVPPSRVFRNTELITSNGVAKQVQDLGYDAILAEGADHVLRWRSPLFPYRFKGAPNLLALLKNYRLSDDIAFRFSDRGWTQWPLTSEKYLEWVRMIDLENPVAAKGGGARPFVGLFMDYETFGEHQWADTGIFDFMRALPRKFLDAGFARFITPSDAVRAFREQNTEVSELDAEKPFSWADVERDLSAWQGNPIQDAALRSIYKLEPHVHRTAAEMGGEEGAELLETWRRLLTSDHFYYMCTKYFADGDVHKYFNPYDSPYDAHIIFMNVLADMSRRCGVQERATA
jgi:alpha-amylase